MKKARISALEKTLRRLEKKHGYVSPKLLVDEAAPENHPLHDQFEWDDEVAGPLYRENQARVLIRSVVYIKKSSEIIRFTEPPVYVRNPDRAPQQGYVSLDEARLNAELAERIIKSELARIEGAVERGRAVADRLNLSDEFEHLLDQVTAIRELMAAA
jgi:hypothetical protein